jgi:Fe-S cluster assembly ATP-binding protein
MLLEIKNLKVSVNKKMILNGINLEIDYGQIHAVMGPNGSGKSTLSKVIAGAPGYVVEDGQILYKGQDIAKVLPEERARLGIFLGFQYPIEVPGVNNASFLRMALNSKRKFLGQDAIDPFDFEEMVKEKLQIINMDLKFLERELNYGFSGGEKKRNEIVQMAVLEPEMAILDEIDSGLDIDALRFVAQGINALRHKKRAMLLITHYQRLLDFVEPDFVHVILEGKIVQSGKKELVSQLEAKGYDWLKV